MNKDFKGTNIQTRRQLYDWLQAQMQTAYKELSERQRLKFESTLIKSYIFEVNTPSEVEITENSDQRKNYIEKIFHPQNKKVKRFVVYSKEEFGFYEINLMYRDRELNLFLDTSTNSRFWLGFSLSTSSLLDLWFENLVRNHIDIDFVWLWPSFLEQIQKRGVPRGFGLDYDYRKFEKHDSDKTTYFKMQLWGGEDTENLYKLLKEHKSFRNKVVLSKIRMKEFIDLENRDLFALQDIKYTGKFTTRGTNFSVHTNTLSDVRKEYAKEIELIEKKYRLRWVEKEKGRVVLYGFAIHFIPMDFVLPVQLLYEKVFDGTAPFRMLGFYSELDDSKVIAKIVDFHTGGEIAIELYPDLLSVYLPENTCGNSIARLYTNLQHFFNKEFTVEADNGDKLFQSEHI